MRSIDVSARTIEEAVSDGLQKLGCSISDCKVDILQEGAKGLFGVFGSKPALVRLTLLEADTSDPFDISMFSPYSTKENTKRDKAGQEPKAQPEEPPEGAKVAAPAPVRNAVQGQKTWGEKKSPQPKKALQDIPVFQGNKPPQEQKTAVVAEKKPAQKNTMRIASNPQVVDRPSTDKTQVANKQQSASKRLPMGTQQPATKPDGQEKAQSRDVLERFKNAPLPGKQKASLAPKTPRPKRAVVSREESGQSAEPHEVRAPMPAPAHIEMHAEDTPAGVAQSFLLTVTRHMGVDVKVDVRHDEEGHLFATMYGDTLGILIGRRGDTLDALQYLTSLQVNKGQDEYIRCTLDTENYRAKREEALARLASRMANRAIKTGRKVSLEPMNPYERRILHSSLQGNPNVSTHSEGDEPYRHVVVVPQKQ